VNLLALEAPQTVAANKAFQHDGVVIITTSQGSNSAISISSKLDPDDAMLIRI